MTILIVDIQETYRTFCHHLINPIAKAFNDKEIYYLYDSVNGERYEDQVPEEWTYQEYSETEELFSERFNKIFTKQYGFFRCLMDSEKLSLDSDDIISLGKWMLKEDVTDMKEIYRDEDLERKFKRCRLAKRIKEIDFNDYSFWLPEDLISELKDRSFYTLVGGGVSECLKEVSLLLHILDIDHEINHDYCY